LGIATITRTSLLLPNLKAFVQFFHPSIHHRHHQLYFFSDRETHINERNKIGYKRNNNNNDDNSTTLPQVMGPALWLLPMYQDRGFLLHIPVGKFT
jgi:hypothetical protein